MKAIVLAAALLGAALPAMAQTNVSITVGQPGFYGRIDLGGYAPPPVVYAQPIIVQRPVRVVEPQVVYLRVPPGHQKHWDKFCGRYNACGQRVYFVRDDWYLNTYAPQYQERHGHGHDERHGHDDDHDDHDGEGHGHGHGHGHGKH